MATSKAPGLKRARRAGGDVWYWVAADVSRKAAEYLPKTIRLTGESDEARAAECAQHTARLREWLADRANRPTFNGTIASLIDCYQRVEGSPFHDVKANTRADYEYRLREIGRVVGSRHVARLNRDDFVRWHRGFARPAPGGEPKVRKAHGLMTMLRMLFGFGVSMRYPGCADASAILSEIRFKVPAPRRQALTFEQAAAVVDEALRRGRRSIALGQALQFELTLRQVDVIGLWYPHDGRQQGIIYRGNRWADGLLWSDLSPDGVLTKETTKTAAVGQWDVSRYPLVARALAAFPSADRIGPMLVSEKTGLPYDRFDYARDWREIATAAGVPREVWNRDSRAGGITEGWDAGADEKDLQRHATHSDPAMTRRYARNSLASTGRVADIRAARRAKERP